MGIFRKRKPEGNALVGNLDTPMYVTRAASPDTVIATAGERLPAGASVVVDLDGNVIRAASAAATAAAPAPATASVDTGNVRQYFNFDWAMNQEEYPDIDTYWWWVVSVRVDPNEVWMEAEDGTLWVIPFTTDGADTITASGAPTESRLVAVPVSAADGQSATAAVSRRRQRVLAAFHERPDKPAPPTTAAASAAEPDNERTPMDASVLQALARQHGLDPDTATEDDVNAAVLAATETPDEPETTVTEVTETTTVVETTPDPVAETRDAELAAATARIADLERERDERATAAATERRDGLAASWVTEGRIAPAQHDHYRGLLDIDEAGTIALAASLPAGRIPVQERGSTGSGQAASGNSSLNRALAASGFTRKEG